jgi:hypothetical protein
VVLTGQFFSAAVCCNARSSASTLLRSGPLDYLIRNIHREHAAGTLDDAAGRSPMSTGRCERALDAFARETRRVTRATRPSAGEPAPPRLRDRQGGSATL